MCKENVGFKMFEVHDYRNLSVLTSIWEDMFCILTFCIQANFQRISSYPQCLVVISTLVFPLYLRVYSCLQIIPHPRPSKMSSGINTSHYWLDVFNQLIVLLVS